VVLWKLGGTHLGRLCSQHDEEVLSKMECVTAVKSRRESGRPCVGSGVLLLVYAKIPLPKIFVSDHLRAWATRTGLDI
jgi:hypothetical protein